MNKNTLLVLLLILLMGAGIIGGAMYLIKPVSEKNGAEVALKAKEVDTPTPVPAIQQELNDLSAKMVSQLKAEERLNLNMVAQLRSYQEMLRQIEGYAAEVERNLDIIEEISGNEFQEDVQLQAQLFQGKKSTLVAKHLEEFRAARVGAILSKMKEKEASAVLDIWAEAKEPKVSAFYREVMAAYLNNKRREANPKLFDSLLDKSAAAPKRAEL